MIAELHSRCLWPQGSCWFNQASCLRFTALTWTILNSPCHTLMRHTWGIPGQDPSWRHTTYTLCTSIHFLTDLKSCKPKLFSGKLLTISNLWLYAWFHDDPVTHSVSLSCPGQPLKAVANPRQGSTSAAQLQLGILSKILPNSLWQCSLPKVQQGKLRAPTPPQAGP